MDAQERLSKFASEKGLSGSMYEIFLDYLRNKYPSGIPSNINVELEWRQFCQEGTSKL